MPARFVPPTVTAESRAPHSLPFAYVTCCIRVSFASSLYPTSGAVVWENGPTRSFQQPDCPLNSNVVSSLRQCPCGTVTPGALPEPSWAAFGGRAYWFTPSNVLLR